MEKVNDPRSITDHTDALAKVTDCVSDIATWIIANKLKLNRDKTEFLVIMTARNEHEIAFDRLQLGEDCVLRSDVTFVLSILIDRISL